MWQTSVPAHRLSLAWGLAEDASIMAIPEQKLSSWSRSGAQQGSANTYDSIKLALDRHDWPQGMNHHVYLQGSYPNYTNIRDDSDVDVVVESRDVFHHNVPENLRTYYRLTTPAPYTWQQFREEVKRALVNCYGPHGVKDGNKCIKVAGSGNHLNADIVPCTEYRQYDNSGRYVTGITFWTRSGVQIVNFPKSHWNNGAYKNDCCQKYYKPNVRVFKNARNHAENNLSSYFLECMVYNVPDSEFSLSHADTFVHVVNFLLDAITNGSIRSLLCQNGHQTIFGTASHQIDDVQSAERFVNAMCDLWDNWL